MPAAGYRVGCYTSPHLLDYNERVRLTGAGRRRRSLCRLRRVEAARQSAGSSRLPISSSARWPPGKCSPPPRRGDNPRSRTGRATRRGQCLRRRCAIVPVSRSIIRTGLGPTARRSVSRRPASSRRQAGDLRRSGTAAASARPAAAIGADLRLIGRDFGFMRGGENRVQWRWWSRATAGWPAVLAFSGLARRLPVAQRAARWRRWKLPRTFAGGHAGYPARFARTRVAGPLPGRAGPPRSCSTWRTTRRRRVLADNLGSMGLFARTMRCSACSPTRISPAPRALRHRSTAGRSRPGGPRAFGANKGAGIPCQSRVGVDGSPLPRFTGRGISMR